MSTNSKMKTWKINPSFEIVYFKSHQPFYPRNSVVVVQSQKTEMTKSKKIHIQNHGLAILRDLRVALGIICTQNKDTDFEMGSFEQIY